MPTNAQKIFRNPPNMTLDCLGAPPSHPKDSQRSPKSVQRMLEHDNKCPTEVHVCLFENVGKSRENHRTIIGKIGVNIMAIFGQNMA